MKEVLDNKSICTKDGILSDYSIGWSKIPFKDCSIKNKIFMKKIWNRYIWIENNFIFSFFIISLDYSSILIVDFYDMKTKSTINKHMRCKLSKNIIIDDRINSYAYYEDKYRFINVLRINNYLHIEFMWNGIDITSIINLDYESINAVIPWTYNHFHYTSKHISLENEGNFSINNNEYKLLELIVNNSSTTAVEAASALHLSVRQVERLFAALKAKGILSRQGSNKSGKWIVNIPEHTKVIRE